MAGNRNSGRRPRSYEEVDIMGLLQRSVRMVNELLDDPEVSKEKKLESCLKLTQKLIPDRIIHEHHERLSYAERKELIQRLERIAGPAPVDVKVIDEKDKLRKTE